MYKISTEKKSEQDNTEEEKMREQDFLPPLLRNQRGKRDINDPKAPEWMDAKIKIKEVNSANEGQPKMDRIWDYWSDQQTT